MLLTYMTDWIQAFSSISQLIVTGVGFMLLYTTLVLQSKVASDQQKMLEIENRRVRREIRPVFKIEQFYTSDWIENYISFRFYCETNDAYDLVIISKSGKNIKVREPKVTIPFLKTDSKLMYSYNFIDISNFHTWERYQDPENEIIVELRYNDIDGFSYMQQLRGFNSQLEPTRPIPLY